MRVRRSVVETGFTLLEVTIVGVILTIAIVGVMAVFTSITQQTESALETDVAVEALRSKVEEMRSTTFTAVFASYTSGGTPGSTFAVAGLPAAVTGTAQGAITFLGEADAAAYWGVAADLDGDGSTATGAPVSAGQAASWTALPVVVTVSWQDRLRRSPRSVSLTTLIYDQSQ
jgi:type II secretory pathway pseudopilin PulG